MFNCRLLGCKFALATTACLLAYAPITAQPAASAETKVESQKSLSKYRKRFIEECKKADFNENCARFYESQNLVRKSQEFCLKNPEDPGCIDFVEEKDFVEEERHTIAVHREIEEYCRSNKNTPRCKSRGRKRSAPKF